MPKKSPDHSTVVPLSSHRCLLKAVHPNDSRTKANPFAGNVTNLSRISGHVGYRSLFSGHSLVCGQGPLTLLASDDLDYLEVAGLVTCREKDFPAEAGFTCLSAPFPGLQALTCSGQHVSSQGSGLDNPQNNRHHRFHDE